MSAHRRPLSDKPNPELIPVNELHNPDAERGVLGAVLTDFANEGNAARLHAELIATGLHAAEFFGTAHQILWEAFGRLSASGHPIDELTVAEHLKGTGELADIGGIAFINELSSSVEVTHRAHNWARIVRTHAARRRMAAVTEAMHASARRRGVDLDDTVREIAPGIDELMRLSRGNTERRESVADEVAALRHKFTLASAGEPPPFKRTVSWSLPTLDEAFGPLCAADGDSLVIVAARSGVGKSSLARQMAWGTLKAGGTVQLYLLETMTQQFLARCAGLESGIPYKESLDASALKRWRDSERELIRTGSAYGELARGENYETFRTRVEAEIFSRRAAHHDRAMALLADMGDKRLFVRSNLFRIDAILAAARLAHRTAGKTDLIVVDYLQLVSSDADVRNLRGDEILKDISNRFKALAKECGCPVILISSVTEDGPVDQEPGLESLRGSKDIGYTADRVITIARPSKDANDCEQTDGRREVQVKVRQVKARDQGFASVWCGFVRHLTAYRDLPQQFGGKGGSTYENPVTHRTETRGRPKGVRNGEGRTHRMPGFQPGQHPADPAASEVFGD